MRAIAQGINLMAPNTSVINMNGTKQFEQKDAKVAKQQMLPVLPLRSSRPSVKLLVAHPPCWKNSGRKLN
jgi:hypothetical protein